MLQLLTACLLWAPSFGVIKHVLPGLDPNFVTWTRMLFSFVLFAPLLRLRGIRPNAIRGLLAVGAVQYGIMYVAYTYSYRFLQAHEVALFTIFTPLYVTFINDAVEKRFHWRFLPAVLLAVAGTAVIVGVGAAVHGTVVGWVLVQASNLSFALGQVAYRRLMGTGGKAPAGSGRLRDRDVFGLLYGGALLLATLSLSASGGWPTAVSRAELAALGYLGLVASGVGFFLWNVGARRVNAGTLAVFNNAKIPLAVLVSLLVFGESARGVARLLVGGVAIVGAVLLNETWAARRPKDARTPG